MMASKVEALSYGYKSLYSLQAINLLFFLSRKVPFVAFEYCIITRFSYPKNSNIS
jgi:hypothetical protein